MKAVLRNSIIVVAYNLFILVNVILILLLTSCRKGLEKETPLPDMKLLSLNATVWRGDSLSACVAQKYIGDLVTNNNIVIKGENFGHSIGEVTHDAGTYFDVEIVEWRNDVIIIHTSTDDTTQFEKRITFTIKRDDDEKTATFTKTFVCDIEGFAIGSKTHYIFYRYNGIFKKPLLDEFLENMDTIETDYIPTKSDILKIGSELFMISSNPSVSANAYQRKYTYSIIQIDCNGNTIEKTANFTILNDAIVQDNNTPMAYYRE